MGVLAIAYFAFSLLEGDAFPTKHVGVPAIIAAVAFSLLVGVAFLARYVGDSTRCFARCFGDLAYCLDWCLENYVVELANVSVASIILEVDAFLNRCCAGYGARCHFFC